MQKIIFSIVVAVFMYSNISYADVYVMHKGEEIIGLSEAQDMVLEKGAQIEVIEGTIEEIGLQRNVSFYNFKGGKFKLNTNKILKEEADAVKVAQKAQAKAIKKNSAIDKLKVLGLTEDEINILIGD